MCAVLLNVELVCSLWCIGRFIVVDYC